MHRAQIILVILKKKTTTLKSLENKDKINLQVHHKKNINTYM